MVTKHPEYGNENLAMVIYLHFVLSVQLATIFIDKIVFKSSNKSCSITSFIFTAIY